MATETLNNDPFAARYERVNLSFSGYQKTAIDRIGRKYRKRPSTLVYLWVAEPENPISKRTYPEWLDLIDQLEQEDIFECA